MARLPVISGDEFVKAMRKVGYVWDYTEGSHMILLHPSGRRLSVPRHKELGRGLLRSLIQDAGLTRENLLDYYGSKRKAECESGRGGKIKANGAFKT